MSSMLTLRYSSKTAVVGSNIYLLSGFSNSFTPFEMYSTKTNTWKKLEPAIQHLTDFSVCSFMKSIYVIGGCKYNYDSILINQYLDKVFQSCCYKYDENKWTKVADLQNERSFSACTVFEGKIVVTGGYNKRSFYLKSVESYDHHENTWSSLSSMVVPKSSHSSFSMGNKMFVINIKYNNCCEVYDSISRKFAILNFFIPRKGYDYDSYWSLNIGKKIFIFYNLYKHGNKLRLHVYNLEELELIDEDLVINKDLRSTAVKKYPKS